ncbi:MAG: replication protein [Microviridae sp.]|nr:MAG: replication protein [Microviridae sp.]
MTKVKQKIEFGQIKIDSLRILIPEQEVTNHSAVNKEVQLLGTDGTFYNEVFRKNALSIEHKGCMIRIALASQTRGELQLKAYAISITAKMTGNYFEGITNESLRDIYEFTQSVRDGLIFSFDSFERAMIADIDYAIDFEMKPEELNEIGNLVRRIIKPELVSYFNQFKQKDNIGFEFNRREKATPGKPFVKIYHKTLEIRNKNEGWARHLGEIPQIARLETTIKNSKFWKAAEIEQPRTLKELTLMETTKIKEYTMGTIDRNYTGRLDRLKPMKKAGAERNTKEIIAEELIRHVLENDPIMGTAVLKQIIERMKEAGYNRSTIMRARDFINTSRPEAKPEAINFEENSNIEVMLKALNLIR